MQRALEEKNEAVSVIDSLELGLSVRCKVDLGKAVCGDFILIPAQGSFRIFLRVRESHIQRANPITAPGLRHEVPNSMALNAKTHYYHYHCFGYFWHRDHSHLNDQAPCRLLLV